MLVVGATPVLTLVMFFLPQVMTAGRTHFHRQAALSRGPLPCSIDTCPAANVRRAQAFDMRSARAVSNLRTFPCQTPNSDEELYPDTFLGSFSKGLEHDLVTGVVNPAAFEAFLDGFESGNFSLVPLLGGRKLTNPQAGLMFELTGGDTQSFAAPPPPAFASAQIAAEIVENYWMALLRDTPFDSYSVTPLAAEAAADLNRMSDFRGIKPVTPANLFRSTAPGCSVGPYLSQFFFGDVKVCANSFHSFGGV